MKTLLILMLCALTFAQNHETDSLIQIIRSIQERASRVEQNVEALTQRFDEFANEIYSKIAKITEISAEQFMELFIDSSTLKLALKKSEDDHKETQSRLEEIEKKLNMKPDKVNYRLPNKLRL